MRGLQFIISILGILIITVDIQGAENHGSLGPGSGFVVPGTRTGNPCPGSTFDTNFDGTAENAYCWQYGGIIPGTTYGAFAECFYGCGKLCGIELMLTGVGSPCCLSDLYVWDNAAGQPGAVICVVPGADPCPVALWPSVSTHDFPVSGCCVPDTFWVGFVPLAQPTDPCCYYVAADLDGPGGCPMTNVAPNTGYPTGWQDVSVIWGQTQALGIGTWKIPNDPSCCVNPVERRTWGAIKQLYR